MIRTLLTRRWLAALAVAALFATACVFLGRWQWSRHEYKVERARLVEIASKLGLDEAAVAAAEQEAPRSMPPLIVQSKAPAWLADYWAISSKGKRGPSA